MKTYLDILTGEPLLSDAFPINKNVKGGMLWEVKSKRVPTIFGPCGCDLSKGKEGDCECFRDVPETDKTQIDIIQTFHLQRQPAFSSVHLLFCLDLYARCVSSRFEQDKKLKFFKGMSSATTFLLSKSDKLQFFRTYNMQGSLIFAHSNDNATPPTFIYFAHGLKEIHEDLTLSPVHSLSRHLNPYSLLSPLVTMYQDLLTGDIVLSDLFQWTPKQDGMLWEVEGKFIGTSKVIDIVDTFSLKEIPAYPNNQFRGYMKSYVIRVTNMLEGEKKGEFMKGIVKILQRE